MRRSVLVAAFTAVFSIPLAAQVSDIVAVDSGAGSKVGARVIEHSLSTCKYICCAPGSLETSVTTTAGGAAFDSRLNGTWVTNGLTLACVSRIEAGSKCRYICKPQKMPLPPVTGVKIWATGLAYVDSGSPASVTGPGILFVSYNTGHIATIAIGNSTSPCALKTKFCKVSLGSTSMITGLATDDVRRHLYMAVVITTTAGFSNVIYRSDFDKDPCKLLCKYQPSPCSSTIPLGPITGLGFDPCRDHLDITDGRYTTYHKVGFPTTGCFQLKPLKCCQNKSRYTGICVLPTRDRSDIKSCTVGKCDSCAAVMVAELDGAAVLGNPTLGLTLKNAPNNTTDAVLLVGVGPCGAGGFSPPYCRPVSVSLAAPGPFPVFFLGLTPIAGAGCTRTLTQKAGIPLKPGLCGLQLSMQWLVVCNKSFVSGHGISNCVTVTISGS